MRLWWWGLGKGVRNLAGLGRGSLECPPPSSHCLPTEAECVSVKNNPLEAPPSCSGISPGAEAQGGSSGQPSNLEDHRGRGREIWGMLGRQFEDTGSLQRGEHPFPSLPVALASLRTPEHQAWGWGLGAFQFLASHTSPPSRSLQAQSVLSPSLPLSLSVSVSLLFFSAVLPACLRLSLPPSLSPSSSFLAGRGRGRWGQLHPPPALGPHSERGSEIRERAGREG